MALGKGAPAPRGVNSTGMGGMSSGSGMDNPSAGTPSLPKLATPQPTTGGVMGPARGGGAMGKGGAEGGRPMSKLPGLQRPGGMSPVM